MLQLILYMVQCFAPDILSTLHYILCLRKLTFMDSINEFSSTFW